MVDRIILSTTLYSAHRVLLLNGGQVMRASGADDATVKIQVHNGARSVVRLELGAEGP